ncbi:MAG: M23 family metallopeptidase [Sulfurimonas sp.]|uniref:M23 family metallopeptidase n=1 Tax=Sulfurimonas sp. TaxID=2022749 RepID=UPI0026289CBF|nr:M23 family metallopeptidase [Sulfurimonas sp.]MDD2652437.1 M23 family metallopeptidase [Sulfurimonas sp.]MDD3452173.1 M23 family metallopeptidase [Sulfurimonas sp.]
MRLLFLFGFLFSYMFALDVVMPQKEIANGKTALLEFVEQKGVTYESAVLEQKKYTIFKHPSKNGQYYVLIPIGYETKPQKKEVEIFYKENGVQKTKIVVLDIQDGKYEKETLQVDGSKVTLSQKDKARTEREYAEAMEIYKKATPKTLVSSDFIVPLDSKITSDFGKARVYNGLLKSYHGGTDFRAAVGTPITAANDGKVVLVQDRFYSGQSVIIDHGQGVYTCYFHMSKFHVKESQNVKKGDVIGLSGSSGRVSGPHLHFGIRIGGEQVDPLHFIALANENLVKGKQ